MIAGMALSSLPQTARRVIVIGPSHHVAIRGASILSVDTFSTPFGSIPVDPAAHALRRSHPSLFRDDATAHAREHSVEV